jgi:cytidine deaminase
VKKKTSGKKTSRRPVRPTLSGKISRSEAERLVLAASDARGRAYAPYSGYKVGAALLTLDGKIYGGCNVENSSYGLCVCAERCAMGSAVCAGQQEFRAIAVVTEDIGSPCGACRQFFVEFNPEMTVILADASGKRKTYTAKQLLPDYFLLND